MEMRRINWLPWALAVPGLVMAGCSDPAPTTPPRDTGAELAADVGPDEGVPDVAQDAGDDAKAPDAGEDATPPEDVGDDALPPKDVGEDVALDIATDEPAPDAGDDAAAPDAADDAPAPDAADDAPAPDAPSMDAPAPDAPAPDAPAPDAPAPDAGGMCPFPTQRALALPTDSAMGTLAGMSRINMACAAVGGPDHIYPIRVAARTGLMLSTSAMIDTVLMLRRACDSATGELACNDDVPGATTSLIRRVVDPGDYYVVVDQYGMGGTGGAYTLNVASYTPAANAECAMAAPLTAAAPVTGNTTGGGAAAGTCVTDQWGGQLFYSLTIPPGQRATVTATPTGTPAWRAVVRAQANCAATACLANGVSAMPGAPASEVIDNRGTAPLNVTVSVASSTPLAGGAFSLSVAFSTPPMPPANAACATARPVMNGTTLTGENPSLGTTRLNTACLNNAQGTALFYRVTVPSRATLEFDATPTGMWDPVIRLLNACGATSCLASANGAGNGALETLSWLNVAAAPQEVYVAVGSNDASNSGPFNGAVRIVPPPANTTCRAATAVMSGATLASQNAAAGIENATGACLPGATGTVLYYAVRVPAGNQLIANVTAAAGVDPVIRVLDACGATSCLANANANGVGGAESVTWTNAAGDRTVYLAIGGNTNATNGSFSLTVNVRREYTESSIPRACDDMTGGAPLMGVNGDDTVTGILDLPFAFTFYGERELEYSVSSNGLIQLWPNLMGAPTNSYGNVGIPNTEAPNRYIAAFWDDLFPLGASMGMPASSVLTRTLGAAPNRRFVIQWTGFSVFDDQTARLTLQAKLFEGTNVIELHYCTLTPGMMATRTSGDSATVGIESPDGRAGLQHSFNRANAVNTMNGIRFTP
ncbi:MAG: hypothetical protein U0324_12980 [Polyangiales bacterium]